MQQHQRVHHVAHLGRPARLDALLAASGLGARAREAGLAGGVGVGWYPVPEVGRPGTAPLRYRRAVPLWADAGLPALAASVTSGCVLAAARSAPDGGPADESACPPFLLGDVLLSHDGEVPGVAAALGRLVPSSALAGVGSTVPSAFVAALVAARLSAGDALPAALHATARLVADRVPGAGLGLLATDGRCVAAVACGAPLGVRAADGSVVVASGPPDDDGWEPVADRSLVTVTLDGVEVVAL